MGHLKGVKESEAGPSGHGGIRGGHRQEPVRLQGQLHSLLHAPSLPHPALGVPEPSEEGRGARGHHGPDLDIS